MRRIVLLLGLVLAFAATTASAQQTWIVDANNGFGTDFTDLPAALANASVVDGDILHVRAGQYNGTTTGKAVSIIGQSGAVFSSSADSLIVDGVGSGKDFVLQGMEWSNTQRRPIFVRNCQGRVLFDRVDVTVGWGGGLAFGQGIVVEASRQVSVSNSLVRGMPGIEVTSSTLICTDSEILGNAGQIGHGSIDGAPGISASQAELVLSRGRVEGGNGINFTPVRPPKPAITAVSSTLTVYGDGQTVLTAGGVTPFATSAIQGSGSALTIDPAVQLLTHLGAPPVGGSIAVTQRRLASLAGLGAPPGGVVQLDVYSPQGDAVAIFSSPPGDKVTVPPYGDFWLDFGPFVILVAQGTQGPTEHLQRNIQLPNLPGLFGKAFVWQAISADVAGGVVRLSNPFTAAMN